MKRLLPMVGLAFVLVSCSDPIPPGRGVYMLMDTSGTYTRELRKAQQIINAILAQLEPGDTFAVARIDTGSFSERDIVARMVFDDRPSMTNQQKRKFRDLIEQFVRSVKPATHTDITGGILQAVEYLNEKNPGRKTILIELARRQRPRSIERVSDLKEDLKAGYIRDIPLTVDGYSVIALNVTKLNSDNIDPRKYLNRLETWQARVESGGGTWRVVNDLEGIERVLRTGR